MPTWIVYRYSREQRTTPGRHFLDDPIGEVDAPSQPHAIVKAHERWPDEMKVSAEYPIGRLFVRLKSPGPEAEERT